MERTVVIKIEVASNEFIRKVADLANKYNIPALVFNQGSIFTLTCVVYSTFLALRNGLKVKSKSSEVATQAMNEYAMAMAAEGIIVAGGNKTY